METNKKNKLLMVAWIFGCILVLGLICLCIKEIIEEIGPKGWFLKFGPEYFQIRKEEFKEGFIVSAVLLFVWIISVSLNIIGWQKNNRKVVLVAGIIYTLGLNIVSGVLCFIAFAKLKKQVH